MPRKTTKNPLLSLWLSGANAAAGAGRGLMAAEAARQRRAMMREMEKTTLAFWSSALKPLAPRQRKTRKTRK